MKHKYADVIKAWADGVEIEGRFCQNEWKLIKEVIWLDWEYRVKPTPKPDWEVSRWVFQDGSTGFCTQSNVKYTFDGETRKLKAAEVIE
jgi:hypothetical protein